MHRGVSGQCSDAYHGWVDLGMSLFLYLFLDLLSGLWLNLWALRLTGGTERMDKLLIGLLY